MKFFQKRAQPAREEQRHSAYLCRKCGKTDVYRTITAAPVCCGEAMQFLHVMFQGADPDNITIDVIKIWPPPGVPEGIGNVWPGPGGFWIYTTPRVNWHYQESANDALPRAVWEVYQLRPGRVNGERIGWIGKRGSNLYEYRAVPGVREASSYGTKLTREDCVEALVEAIEEG